MKKRMVLLSVLLSLVLLVGGCAPGGKSVSVMDAQIAFAAVLFMGIQAGLNPSVFNPPPGQIIKEDGPPVTLRLVQVPDITTAPYTTTITASNWVDSGTGYVISGTTVMSSDGVSGGTSSTVYNLSMSSSTWKVNSVTGTSTSTGGTSSGTLYFNGEPYTLAELGF